MQRMLIRKLPTVVLARSSSVPIRGWVTDSRFQHGGLQRAAMAATRTITSTTATAALSGPPASTTDLKLDDVQSHESRSPFERPPSSQKAIGKKRREFVPRKAAVQLTDRARKFFQLLLKDPPRKNVVGIMLNYGQPKSGEPRMVYSFDFVTAEDIDWDQDEGVSLELVSQIDRHGNRIDIPKPPSESQHDGLPKLYVHHHAFLKVLGATLDVDTETLTPILIDREGNTMDPNA